MLKLWAMFHKFRLYTPGPTPVPEAVFLKMAEPQQHHRTAEFRAAFEEATGLLKQVFRTNQPVYTVTGSGTSAFEAGLVSTLAPGKTVLNVTNGKFSERWAAMSTAYGLECRELKYDYGDHATAEDVGKALAESAADAVIVTHSETSTGAACDLHAISKIVREKAPDALLIVDGITSIGTLPFEMDAWGVDVAITGSQKALMLPPGLGFVALSGRAEAAMKANDRKDNFYLDLRAYEKAMGNWDTPYTPNNQQINGLIVSLKMILDEGLETVWKRCHACAAATRAGVEALGLEVFAKMPGDSVSAIKLPDGVSDDQFRKPLKKKYNIHLAGGQGSMKGSLFRVNHMGYTDTFEALAVISAIELVMAELGKPVEPGKGVAAAQRALAEVS